nr:hypothetical protein [Tanacetum cinerariifolium]
NKKCTVNAEVFRTILDICPRVKGVYFTYAPDDDTALTFLIDVVYMGLLNKHTNMFVDHMHQPWRTLAAIINKCLSEKTASNDKLRNSRIDILLKFVRIDVHQIFHSSNPTQERQMKGSQGKKTADTPVEEVKVSEELEPEPARKKTSSKRMVKKKVILSVDENIIFDDLDASLETVTESVPKSAKKKSGGRSSKSVVIQDTPSALKSKPATSKTKLKGAPSLTVEELNVADIMQAHKESKKSSKRQPVIRGSHEGTGTILGVLDESTIVFTTSSEGTGDKPEDNKDDDADDDEGNDHISDTQDTNDEDVKTESDEDDIYKYKIHIRKDVDEEMINAEVDDSNKGDEEITDVAMAYAEKTSEAKHDAKNTKLPSSSSRLSIPSGFGDKFLKLSSNSYFESPSTATPTTLPPPSISTTPSVAQQTTKLIPTPTITTDALIVTTTVPKSNALTAVKLRVAKLEKDMSELKTIDHSTKALAILKSQVPYFPESIKKQTPTVDLEQGYKKSDSEILQIKKEQAEKQQKPKFTIKSTDKAALEEKTLNPDWFKQPPMPLTPDPEWNKHQVVLDQPAQPWFNQMVFATKDPPTFNYLMATLIDFSKYVLNGLKIENLTQDTLLGPAFNLLKGHRTIVVEYFFNNDLEYLKTSDPKVTYTTSITKTKAARCEIKRIKYMVSEFSKKNVYYTKTILGVKSVSVKKLHGYDHLEEIVVKRSDQQLYKLKKATYTFFFHNASNENTLNTRMIIIFVGKLISRKVEARLVEFKEHEVKFYERIIGLEKDVEIRDNKIEYLTNELEQVKKEKESLDIKLTGLPEFVDDTVTNYSRPTPSIDVSKCNTSDLQSSNFSISEHGGSSGSIMKSTMKYAEMYRNISKSPKVRENQRNWNNLTSQQLGKDFLMQNKACFNCGYFDHLAPNCGVWVEKGKTWPKDNYAHKRLTPRAVLLKPGTTPIAVSRPNMNVAQPKMTSFSKTAPSNVKRPFQGKSAVKTQPRVPRVSNVTKKFPTVDSKFPTAKSTFTADLGNKGKAVKASACWIWRPKQNTTEEGLNCNGVSGNPQNNIDDKGYWDSGCSRHMTGNISYLSEKQHKASYKTKLVNSISKPLHTLHMDLFGPTSVSSLNHKWYCLVVTDDFSRFTWNLFLRTKDETSSILRNFITEIENLKDLKVKIIRCDNRVEYKNKEMNEFCTKKGIRREFSNARTPQQNRVAKRRNRTLIEAARTMLADAKLPVTFWAEAVNTASYVQNRVLVNKSQNKTSYELFNSRTHAIGFLRPFGCYVMILTLDHLGKFNPKGDEGYFVRYSLSSKAFRVFKKRTKKVEENMYVDFLENKLIEKGAGPNWLFDIDTLTNSMNYVPMVVAGTSSTNISGTKDVASQDVKKDVSSLRYIALPNWFHEAHMETRNSDAPNGCCADVPKSSGISNPTATLKVPSADQVEPAVSLTVESEIPTISSPVPTVCLDISLKVQEEPKKIFDTLKDPSWVVAMQEELLQFKIQNVWILVDCPKGEEGIDYEEVFASVARIEAIRLFLAYASFMGFIVYQMDVKSAFLYGTIDEEIYVMQPPRFQDLEFPDRVYKVEKAMYGLHQAPRAWYGTLSKYLLDNGFQRGIVDQTLFIRKHKGEFLLVQVYVDDIIFGSPNPQLCREFEALMHDKFQMSAMGELTFFLCLKVLQKKDGIFLSQGKHIGDILKKFGYSDVRSADTPMDKENPWGKDRLGKEVELYLYRSMIGSLMYLTASRPDIMFVVCACARHQVTPKECHLHAVKRIL